MRESEHHGYAASEVPIEAQGSGWRIFFIVAGTVCGLPNFILSARIFGSLGFRDGLEAVLLGAAIAACLGAVSAFTGSLSKLGLALLADRAFGAFGARVIKLVIATCLVGWFGVIISVLGETAARAIYQIASWSIRPLELGLPISMAIAALTARGVSGLERIGNILVPATLAVLLLSTALAWPHVGDALARQGSGALSFGGAVSATVGTYVVGIVIQPDYGRFIRQPAYAALGTGLALGIAFPIVMILSSVASLALGASDLMTAMVELGFGIPALAVLVLGSWIDASASLYSAALAIANQTPRTRFVTIIAATWLASLGLVVADAQSAFIPFLITLGTGLPPLAAVLVLSHFFSSHTCDSISRGLSAYSWGIGTVAGYASSEGHLSLTGVAVLDSVVVAVGTYLLVRAAQSFRARLR